jgi:hypothetical protein
MDKETSESEEVPAPGCTPKRQPGALRGQIHMAEDFDIFPDDMLNAMEA